MTTLGRTKAAAPGGTAGLWRFAFIVTTALLLGFAALEVAMLVPAALSTGATIGLDFTIYMERTESWMAGEGFYSAHQLAGPYTVTGSPRPAFYPPTLLYLTVPFTVLPAVLWWAIPLGVIGYALYRMRPPMWTWPLLSLALAYPRTLMILLYGNPSMWAFAALAAGLVWTLPTAWTMLKPTLAPFALMGIHKQDWWLGAGIGLLLALPFGAMWLDYLTTLTNARNDDGLFYLLGEWPIALVMVVAAKAR